MKRKNVKFTFPVTIELTPREMDVLMELAEQNQTNLFEVHEKLVDNELIEFSNRLTKKNKKNTWILTKRGLLCLMRAK